MVKSIRKLAQTPTLWACSCHHPKYQDNGRCIITQGRYLMTSKSQPKLSPLPWTETLVYWVLSFGSHLYSFYQLHKFSKEHETGLEREFQLEKGLLKGFKRDPSDFEWSLWTQWAKKSLLWTLIGHGVISRLTGTFYPKLRLPALTIYGLLAASCMLGIKGVSVLLVHLGVSFSVAQLRKPTLSWTCNLLLLSTLYFQPLQEIQRGWYNTEEEYYMLLFSIAVCGLRFISFSLEHCWSPLERGGLVQLFWLFSYTFYHPFFYNGPIVTYKAYTEQMRRSAEERNRDEPALSYLVLRSGRIILWWCMAEFMIHVMYMHSIQSNETYIEILPPWALGGLALALVQFFYVKYLVLFGLPSMLATLDELVPPKLPRCVSIMYSFTGMWRHFDEGLYRWLIRYIYVPMGGSQHGPVYKVVSTGLAFGFVCLWHGGHDYLQYWALMNWAGVLVENGLKSLFATSCVQSIVEQNLSMAMQRRCTALLSAFSTAMLILSNLVFLGGIHVGRIFWKRVFVQGWSTIAPPMLAFLYCFAQIGLEWTSHPT
ncbi:protein-cysteine N-palmitoyltransferase HHAT isoform 1-T1 [Odontesthes bonariensis]|uniref:protein-cysteine N-palmitoyltransferase HHAT isoform X1 n=2 Tax=Odontesthes bonariensis TaxID=219752 RepID=UPI003F5893BD